MRLSLRVRLRRVHKAVATLQLQKFNIILTFQVILCVEGSVITFISASSSLAYMCTTVALEPFQALIYHFHCCSLQFSIYSGRR